MDTAQNKPSHGSLYLIRLQGALKSSTTSWFGEITTFPQEDDQTVLVGRFADQAALRGFLDHLWNLNFTLLSIERIESQDDPVSQQAETEGRPK